MSIWDWLWENVIDTEFMAHYLRFCIYFGPAILAFAIPAYWEQRSNHKKKVHYDLTHRIAKERIEDYLTKQEKKLEGKNHVHL